MNDDSLFEFPSDFPIKAMGRDTPHFKQLVIDLVAVHATFDAEADVRVQSSSNGTFLSVTVTFEASNREQLDNIYQSLHDHNDILMTF
jgi:putative lipoic acid-binding regulatory protein